MQLKGQAPVLEGDRLPQGTLGRGSIPKGAGFLQGLQRAGQHLHTQPLSRFFSMGAEEMVTCLYGSRRVFSSPGEGPYGETLRQPANKKAPPDGGARCYLRVEAIKHVQHTAEHATDAECAGNRSQTTPYLAQ